MEKRKVSADTIVGLFVFIGIVVINLLTVVIRDDLLGSRFEVSASFESVPGLEVGAPVLVSGIRGGRVSGIEYLHHEAALQRNRKALDNGAELSEVGEGPPLQPVIVNMIINKDIPIYSNARVRLVQQGFIGDKRVEIDPGSPEDGNLLSEDSPPLRGQPQIDMEQILKRADLIVADLQTTVASFREFVTDDANINAIRDTIANLNRSVEKVYDYLETNEENVEATIADLRVVTANMKQFSEQAKRYAAEGGEIDRITGEVRMTVEEARAQLDALLSQANETVASVNEMVGRVDERSERITGSATSFMDTSRDEFEELSNNLEETSTNLNAVISSIRRGEGTLGRLVTDPEPFENMRDATAALQRFLVTEPTLPDEFSPEITYEFDEDPSTLPLPSEATE